MSQTFSDLKNVTNAKSCSKITILAFNVLRMFLDRMVNLKHQPTDSWI